MAKRISLTAQQKYIDTWQQSGLSKAAFCRQYDLPVKIFYRWFDSQPRPPEATENSKPPVLFIPGSVVSEPLTDACSNTITLHLSRCSVSCSPEQLPALMQVLKLC